MDLLMMIMQDLLEGDPAFFLKTYIHCSVFV